MKRQRHTHQGLTLKGIKCLDVLAKTHPMAYFLATRSLALLAAAYGGAYGGECGGITRIAWEAPLCRTVASQSFYTMSLKTPAFAHTIIAVGYLRRHGAAWDDASMGIGTYSLSRTYGKSVMQGVHSTCGLHSTLLAAVHRLTGLFSRCGMWRWEGRMPRSGKCSLVDFHGGHSEIS